MACRCGKTTSTAWNAARQWSGHRTVRTAARCSKTLNPARSVAGNRSECPDSAAFSNTGAAFGFNPLRINANQTLVHDVLFHCADCDKQYQAVGYSMIGSRNGESSPQALAALAEVTDNAEPLRFDLVVADDDNE